MSSSDGDDDPVPDPTTSSGNCSNFIRKPNPFAEMRIADNEFLSRVDGRQPCGKCYKSRKFFCYTCYIPLPDIERPYPVVRVRKDFFFCKL